MPPAANPLESRDREKLRAADRLGAVVTSAPKWIALAVAAWQARLAVEALAGKNSLAAFLVRFDRQTTSWELVCWVAGLAGIFYGLYAGYLLRRARRGPPPRRGALREERERLISR